MNTAPEIVNKLNIVSMKFCTLYRQKMLQVEIQMSVHKYLQNLPLFTSWSRSCNIIHQLKIQFSSMNMNYTEQLIRIFGTVPEMQAVRFLPHRIDSQSNWVQPNRTDWSTGMIYQWICSLKVNHNLYWIIAMTSKDSAEEQDTFLSEYTWVKVLAWVLGTCYVESTSRFRPSHFLN